MVRVRSRERDRPASGGTYLVGAIVALARLDVLGDPVLEGLEGVEQSEASALADPLRRAIDAANQAGTAEPRPARNVSQREANAVAAQIPV